MDHNTTVKPDAVIRLFENNLLDHIFEGGRHYFVYQSGDFSLKFNADWFSTDPSMEYSLKQVRQVLKKMFDSATREEQVYKFMKDGNKIKSVVSDMTKYGIQYREADGVYIYVKPDTDTVLFKFELDYLIALLVDNPDMSVESLLDGMKESAEFDLAK